MNTTAHYVEFFHLVFLSGLRAKTSSFEFVLKGGGNLRYFHRSVRYSQDLDLDILVGNVDTVQAAVHSAMQSGVLASSLAAGGVMVQSYRPGKQTETTQRWTITLDIALQTLGGNKHLVPTKIEFSARPEMFDYEGETASDFIPPEVMRHHAIRAPLITHYLPSAAIIQKIRTLVERSRVQSRDVFDLELLFGTNSLSNVRGRVSDEYVRSAIERTYEIPFEAFQEQVVAFLDDDYVEQYNSRTDWDRIQLDVIEHLEGLL